MNEKRKKNRKSKVRAGASWKFTSASWTSFFVSVVFSFERLERFQIIFLNEKNNSNSRRRVGMPRKTSKFLTSKPWPKVHTACFTLLLPVHKNYLIVYSSTISGRSIIRGRQKISGKSTAYCSQEGPGAISTVLWRLNFSSFFWGFENICFLSAMRRLFLQYTHIRTRLVSCRKRLWPSTITLTCVTRPSQKLK